ncbi:hypothetical protein F5X99DRAFT_123493 [Biscogniauxia marginata]|nr:hypothetical protein F5X99DRAFT_123493 [Biscogniauxia marginata]
MDAWADLADDDRARRLEYDVRNEEDQRYDRLRVLETTDSGDQTAVDPLYYLLRLVGVILVVHLARELGRILLDVIEVASRFLAIVIHILTSCVISLFILLCPSLSFFKHKDVVDFSLQQYIASGFPVFKEKALWLPPTGKYDVTGMI